MNSSRGWVAFGCLLVVAGCAAPSDEEAVDKTQEDMICTTCPGVPPTHNPRPPTFATCAATKIAIETHYWDVGPVDVTLYTSSSCSGYYWAEADALSVAGGTYNVWVDDQEHDHLGLVARSLNAANGYSETSALVSGGGLRACVSVYGASDQFSRIGCTSYH